MRFPFPLGAGVFADVTRLEDAREAIQRIGGEGGFSDDEESIIRRTDRVVARGLGAVSLYTDRLLEQMIPPMAGPQDMLPDWESWYQVSVPGNASVEERQELLYRKYYDHGGAHDEDGFGGGRGVDVIYFLEAVVGAGNCFYRYNKADDLRARGQDPRGIFAVAFEVPVQYIQTIGQLELLRGIIEVHKPIHVGAAVTRTVARGFLTDDPLSLTDRDVLRI